MVGATVVAHFFQDRGEGGAGHVGVDEVTEAVAAFVFAGGVVGVGLAAHEDDAHFLSQTLGGDGDAGGAAAGEHDDAVPFDHALGGGAGGVGFGLGVAGDIFDFHAVDAVAPEGQRFHGVEHAAVAFAVDVFDGETVGAQFVGAFVGVGAGLRDIEAEDEFAEFFRVVAEVSVGPGLMGEGDGSGAEGGGAALDEAAAGMVGVFHGFFPPLFGGCPLFISDGTHSIMGAPGRAGGFPL